ncbi:hypothetical protein COT62_03620 [Candidatus Roizmanbacteria bacterium CG09_land_8_20_14_0_10_41_9]|uniref:Uncharacterized protein n=1 Tax=Candidatus Roizmanbacteria bacterium CG09_land_8_20_14_0_10_41_9 TaxID=1974850 RepID=A0A2H0WS52_9BACT|nr:MAG: hypothetical protein COT62_03620 [Candidatus Roizmanbacteria bacterium CG09_land_8_20_14_0_10_41_9]
MKHFTTNSDFVHTVDENTNDSTYPISKVLLFLFVAIIAGGLIGFGASKLKKTGGVTSKSTSTTSEKGVGIVDKKTFPDNAEGKLLEGGIDGEGNFHLVRPGGESQNVYLTSTTVDLSEYVGKKVRVSGQTFTGEKAGWLMDVGFVEVLQ